MAGSFAKATTTFLKELKDLENSIAQMERQRKQVVEQLRWDVENDDDPDDAMVHQLRQMVASRHEIGDLLTRLAAAMDNSQGTFDRLEAKATKDEQLLADVEVVQKRRGRGPVFDDKHPVVRKHRNAIDDLVQKLEFLDAAIIKFADQLDLKTNFGNRGPSELMEIDREIKRLRKDFRLDFGGGPKSHIGMVVRSLQSYRSTLTPEAP